ncbi:MAG TPA: vWA domain-containing protein [Polyangiaceae bacterium]|nr:vWA domain-containing protein [Polyangiaceae bacterium]
MTKASVVVSFAFAMAACGGGNSSSNSDNNTPINLGSGASGNGSGAAGGGTPGSGAVNQTTVDQLRAQACQGWSSEPESLPSILEFVVDTSGSMNDMTASTRGQTKWNRTRDALTQSLDELPASVGVGLLLFPNMNTLASDQPADVTNCVNTRALIPLALLGPAGSAQRRTLATSINAVMPQSYTPTYDAYTSGVDLGLLPSKLPGKRFMVLITDGAPTLAAGCVMPGGGGRMRGGGGGMVTPVDPTPIVQAIQLAHDHGIQTFIIGSPGSEESINGTDARVAWLSKAARAGGTDTAGCSDAGPNFCHIDLTQSQDFAAALEGSLAKIAGQVVQCSYPLPSAPSGKTLDLNAINVVYTSGNGSQSLLSRSADANCTEGWKLTGSQVDLCSNTCNTVKADSAAKLELLFGCNSVTAVK